MEPHISDWTRMTHQHLLLLPQSKKSRSGPACDPYMGPDQSRNFREVMKAMAAVAPQFGLLPFKK